MRLTILLCLSIFLSTLNGHAQLPQLTSSDKASPINLKKLDVEVKIIGNRSATTFTMTFYNPSAKVLEGTFILPLPEGAAVTRYALDINGKMREGVPVEKAKATTVFESIERRKVDPGLLEKTEGNVFRTRIFPIPARGERSISIGLEQEILLNRNNELIYHLPMELKVPIEKFSINLNVKQHSGVPLLDSVPAAGLKFLDFGETCCAYLTKDNITLDGSLVIRMPKQPADVEVFMQRGGGEQHFYLHTFLPAATRDKVLPKKIALIWDVSLSGLYRNTAKEIELLAAYLKRCGSVRVELYMLNNSFKPAGVFDIKGGNAYALLSKLRALTYDGGTDYSKIKLPEVDETIFFSDGLSTLSDFKPLYASSLVYTVSSSTKVDFGVLRSLAETNGGVFINLQTTAPPEALEALTKQTLRFLGIKANKSIVEHYPSLSTPVQNGFSMSGKIEGDETELVLQFGYGNQVTLEKKARLFYSEYDAPEWSLRKLFAAKKIDELDRSYEKNREEILRLGKQHSIVTRNTSLLVLEELADYVEHEIEPPFELRAEYKRLMNQRRSELTERRKSTLENAVTYADALWKWWNTSYPLKPVITRRKPPGIATDSIGVVSDEGRSQVRQNIMVQDVTLSEAPIRVEDSRVTPPQIAKDEEIMLSKSLEGSVAGMSLSEVVVVGYGTNARGAVAGNASGATGQLLIVDGVIASALPPRSEIKKAAVLDAKAAVALYGSKAMNGAMLVTTKSGSTSAEPQINISEQTSTAGYMKSIASASKEKQYQTYLNLRDKNLLNPTFYYEVASYFLKGDKALGLQVLTNLGELDYQNHELLKLLGYKLKELGEREAEEYVFRKILTWRPQEPQSYRDYALALMDNGKYQHALDTLHLALTNEYKSDIMESYTGIEETIVTEMSNLLLRAHGKLNTSGIDRKLLRAMPVDIRVVLNWNMADTDMDLWVTDPDGEKCMYSNRETKLGGRISDDFTDGYGPEQFLLKKAKKGKYKMEVDYYGSSSVKVAGKTTLFVEVFTDYGRANQQRKLITLQLEEDREKEGIYVGEFVF